jgi:predicted nucleic acid-binding protein
VASNLLRVFRSSLDPGEAETIALAADLKHEIIIVDEQEGRQLATSAGFTVTGVLGVPPRAKLAGTIPAARPEIQALRNDARFFATRAPIPPILQPSPYMG